ncbi:hypothetical protein [Fluviicola taffensis]|uniref:Alpha/beta hydrolase n=1 Tax=Fluviicola taffensis (strain DSM 16823 / NCIMB 13979 / RW262) TaxID=755732 RepID=F2IB77_FLUTR|nr:hypothetical protein [Fluviicola taffensis]AEA43163.1 hypothetical protein Fluta_1168 [Fluviicola taffensis DSM 16823]
MKLKTLLFILFNWSILSAIGQNESFHRPNFQTKTSLVYYYFWEEDIDGSIVPSTLFTPFSLNRVILIDTLKSSKKCVIADSILRQEILKIGRNFSHKSQYSKKLHGGKLVFNAIYAENPQVVVYIKKDGRWKSSISNLVLHFESSQNDKIFYRSSGNTIYLQKNKSVSIQNNTYRVVSYFNPDNSGGKRENPYFQHVFAFTGEEISEEISQNLEQKAKRYLVFVNGYRGPKYDSHESRNEVYTNDRTNYWFKIDDRFIQRLKPDTTFYLDGSFSVKTSNHASKLKFGWSYIRSVNARSSKRKYLCLNQKCNPEGFDYRYSKGILVGKAFLNELHNTPKSYLTKDTIDIVCHSMGYAYTLGFLETIKESIILGKFYLIAPENAGYKGLDWNKFEEVWQYGSNLGLSTADALRYQDGVAPQTAVWGIEAQKSAHVGRIFSPENWPNKHFVHSHMIYSYDWIFDRIQKGQAGYIH